MTTTKTPRRRRRVISSIVSAVMLLAIISAVTLMAIAWHFAGYEPDGAISLSGLCPLAVKSDGTTLIAGTPGKYHNGFSTHVVGPIRFLDLATGKDSQSPLALKDGNEIGTTIAAVKLSEDEQRLVVVENEVGWALGVTGKYYITVFDLAARAVILEKNIPLSYNPGNMPIVQLSHDGRLLACLSNQWPEVDRSVIVWDLKERKERFRLHNRSRASVFQLSPDGKMLVTSAESGIQLSDTGTGAVVRSLKFAKPLFLERTPAFSPDSKLVAFDSGTPGIQVLDTASGKLCFQTKGWSPQFLPDGSLLGVRDSGRPVKVNPQYFFIPEIVVWSSNGWAEKRAFVYDLAQAR